MIHHTAIPDPHMIESHRSRDLTWLDAFREIFDNAFDAGATKISVKYGKPEIEVQDNGRGVFDLSALFTLGRHRPSRGDVIGEFGVGGKEAAAWIGNIFQVESFNGKVAQYGQVDWRVYATNWDWAEGESIPPPPDQQTFTRLTYSEIQHKLAGQNQLIENLERELAPGLRGGVEITFNGIKLRAPALPDLVQEHVFEGEFDGRPYRLRYGVKAHPKKDQRRFGYDVACKNRLVRASDDAGAFGDYSAMNFYGYLELIGDEWSLSTHKKDFAEREDLYEELLPLIEPVLIDASQGYDEMELNDACGAAADLLAAAIKSVVKEKRASPTPKEESTNPKVDPSEKTPRKPRQHASKVDPAEPGSVIAAPSGKIKIIPFSGDEIGHVQGGGARGTTVIHVNMGDAYHVNTRNLPQLTLTALALYADHMAAGEGYTPKNNPIFPELQHQTQKQRFVTMFSYMLRHVIEWPADDATSSFSRKVAAAK